MIYTPEFEFIISKLLESRTNLHYDIVEGELEMLCLSYWKLDTQDLRTYDQNVVRKNKKKIFSYIIDNIYLHIKRMSDNVGTDLRVVELLNTALIELERHGVFDDELRITTLSLFYLKKHLCTILTTLDMPFELFEIL